MKILVSEVPDEGVARAQTEGLRIYRRQLARRLGLGFEYVAPASLDSLRERLTNTSADAALLMLSWRHDPATIVQFVREVRERTADHLRLVFLDYYAPTCSPVFGVMPYVDRYAKRQVFADPSLYERHFHGGHIFVDYFSRRFDFDIGDWHFGSLLPAEHAHKLVHAWNLGVCRRYIRLLRLSRLFPRRWDKRTYDIHGRIAVLQDKQEWYHVYRQYARDRIEDLGAHYRITPSDRIRPRQFYLELRDSRIAVSPFGWGEVCYRDYEAVVCGALLFKPSMSHLTTSPDIYRPHETYVPLEWDLSDLEEKASYYLSRPDQAMALVHNAQVALKRYYWNGGFTKDVARVIGPS